MLRTASARVQSAILHSIPARLRPPGIPFRMTVFFSLNPSHNLSRDELHTRHALR